MEWLKIDFYNKGWVPMQCHRNIHKGKGLLEGLLKKTVYTCKLSSSTVSKDNARDLLEKSYISGSDVLSSFKLIAYPGSIDHDCLKSVPEKSVPEKSVPEKSVPEKSVPEKSVPEKSVLEGPLAADVKGHSFYVSINSSAEKDHEGLYCLEQLVVHDPGLFPMNDLEQGIPFRDYLSKIMTTAQELFFAIDFNPHLRYESAPIPSYNFSFLANEKKERAAVKPKQPSTNKSYGGFAGLKKGFLC
jgi:hypothetical protein